MQGNEIVRCEAVVSVLIQYESEMSLLLAANVLFLKRQLRKILLSIQIEFDRSMGNIQ